MKRAALFFLCILCFCLAAVPSYRAQVADPPRELQAGPPRGGISPTAQDQLQRMQKQQKAARQKQLKEDTAKLLQLATDLKASVDKTNENILSLDVVKRADEIEKLAKHIKTNMRDEVR